MNILPEKRGARATEAFVPRQTTYQPQPNNFLLEQRNPTNSSVAPAINQRPNIAVQRVTRSVTALAPATSTASSYQFGPADNIDERDAEDPLCVTEYVQDMYHHFREKETITSVRPCYMDNQPHINERMRSILVDWLVEVHLKFKLVPETLYLTVNIIDRYLERKEVSRPKLQLVGVTALLIASKYEEIYPPELRDLVYICDRAYTRTEVSEDIAETSYSVQLYSGVHNCETNFSAPILSPQYRSFKWRRPFLKLWSIKSPSPAPMPSWFGI
jgi:hypothetical protein